MRRSDFDEEETVVGATEWSWWRRRSVRAWCCIVESVWCL